MSNIRQPLTAPIRRVRFVYVALFFALWTSAIGLRLVWLQVVKHHDWMERASKQQQRTFEVAPRRGVLYDRNLRELAVTVLAESVYAVPSELGDNRGNVAELLSGIVHIDPTDTFTAQSSIMARLTASRNFAWIARKLTPEQAQRVRELNLKGVYLQKEFKRFYPNTDLAAQTLGYVGIDDTGLGGMEREFEEDLHGTPGHVLTAVDAKRHALGSEEREPLPGENLVLSIDTNIQYMAERALDAQMLKMKAAHGTVVVQDPHTGQILALAISPRYNPNDLKHQDPSILKNLAVSDVYEPGSTFKLVTYAAALDGAGVEPTDIVDCQGGAMTMYGRTLHDDKSDHFGRVTVQYALEHSSDVGAAKMAMKVGNSKFYDYIRGFGFGDRSGIELPSETRGLLRPARKWEATSIMSIAIGHEVGVTPVQLVTMVSAIANGGTYLPPHILLDETEYMKGDNRLKPAAFHPSNSLPAKMPDGAHRVITELTAAKMRSMMQGTMVTGTGKSGALNGYSAGGKTGTAQKIDPVTHTYSHTRTVASFAGIAPVNNPAISVAVVIDDPMVGTRYGAETSAPVFKQVAQEVLEYLGVPHDQPLKEVKPGTEPKLEIAGDAPSEDPGDLTAMYEEINALPADDPLRQKSDAALVAATASAAPKPVTSTERKGVFAALPEKMLKAFRDHGGSSFMTDEAENAKIAAKPIVDHVQRTDGAVVVDASTKVAVPVMQGGLRAVIQQAAGAGLRVQPVGSGLAREQVPAAGTMVPLGTEVVVRFTR
ncbi:cell division protein FtsI/penicillin-binding protein 2 [Terriglobus roseus DSM 18391]|uniref:Cell division protein FtsI/penicillin-binding protein 2 n=1 Tax=Terriglobus roseus (strain DSM 18391 / NRRL B-41598 / KBS 63) TaxID=926566 RepID=I3ZK97_TERRK|nr:penicillin-binding transpeptidase domain-containing protein [Terriglobus roseus]AFL89665.1 cell division protein FtsI/penicillin-binding protein 2 [Terriglobus roseus DSM 18391]